MDVATLALEYHDGWAKHDPAEIAKRHTEDSVFHLHNIAEPYVGRDAIAAAAARFFADSPDLAFEAVRIHLGDDHLVTEYVMSGTRDGKAYAVDGVDVFTYRDGLVARKDSYIDWVTYEHQTGVNAAEALGRLLPAP
jgi:predicted ester cyclase